MMASGWRSNPSLTALVLGMLVMLGVAIVGLAVDPRIITGVPGWIKPAKFAVSIAIYGATLLWLLRYLADRPRVVRIVSGLLAIGLAVEMALIMMQVVRGTTSHFNYATPFDAMVFQIMAGVIAGVWLLNLVVAILLFRRRFAAPAIVWGVRLGVLAGLLGMTAAFLMPQATPAQDALMDANGSSPIIGAHAVGVPDGGPGLPIVGWSTTGGDLRVAHFVGLHGLQVLIVLGLLLASHGPAWLSARARGQLTIVAGLAWMGLTLLVMWQALRAQPLLAPDGLTLAAMAGLIAIAVGLAWIVVWWDTRSNDRRAPAEALMA
jgi:hypothetical protein